MSVERAQSDLNRLQSEAHALRERLADIQQKITKVSAYLEMAKLYGDGGVIESVTSARASRAQPMGVSYRAVAMCVTAIREARKPLHTRELLEILRQQGLEIGGVNPIANLSGFLSRSSELRNSRTHGWSLKEWPGDFPITSEKIPETMNTTLPKYEVEEGMIDFLLDDGDDEKPPL
jgi:hypothetical protein